MLLPLTQPIGKFVQQYKRIISLFIMSLYISALWLQASSMFLYAAIFSMLIFIVIIETPLFKQP